MARLLWGAFPGAEDDDDRPTCDAADLIGMGDYEGARAILGGQAPRTARELACSGSIGFDGERSGVWIARPAAE